MNVNEAPIQQLVEVRSQLLEELQHLQNSIEKLGMAQTRFKDGSKAAQQVSSAKEGAEMLVPLTSGLQVPGKLGNPNKFLVDVGTDYFVEKNTKESTEFFARKVKTLDENLVSLKKIVETKQKEFEKFEASFRKRLQTQK